MARKIPVYLLKRGGPSPFEVTEYAERLPVEIIDNPWEARLIVGRSRRQFNRSPRESRATYMLWTHEPFFDGTPAWLVNNFFEGNAFDRNLYVFNVHNGLVYTDNFYFAPRGRRLYAIQSRTDLNVAFDNKMISFAATYKLRNLVINGTDHSLNARRCHLAEALHAKKRVRIIGRGWPRGVSESESRKSDHGRDIKAAFLKTTNFNLCYENCVADYYVTEKLWEAIAFGCLPIYYSNGTIYQTFPRHSFIDGRDFENEDQLLQYIDEMTFEEYQRRTNLCRRAFNTVVRGRYRLASRERSLQRLINFLRAIDTSPIPGPPAVAPRPARRREDVGG